MGTSNHPRNENAQGFLSSVGFTERKVYFQKVPSESLS